MHLRTRKGFNYTPQEKFKLGLLDILVFLGVLIVYLWAFFFDSWIPMLMENGTAYTFIDPHSVLRTIPKVNMQVYLGPVILIYEMFVLIIFNGKYRGRYLPWRLYFDILILMIKNKLHEGLQDYKEWRKKL